MTVRTSGELATALRNTRPDAVLACLLGPMADARGSALALASVLVPYPRTGLLVLTAAPASARLLWDAPPPTWDVLGLDSVDTDVLSSTLSRLTTASPAAARTARPDSALTACEQRVLDLLAVGLSNEAIAHRLGVSLKTVETHISRAFGKLGLLDEDHSRNRRVLAALRWSGV